MGTRTASSPTAWTIFRATVDLPDPGGPMIPRMTRPPALAARAARALARSTARDRSSIRVWSGAERSSRPAGRRGPPGVSRMAPPR